MKNHYFLFLILLASPLLRAEQPPVRSDEVYVGDWGIELGVGYAALENPLTERSSFETFLLPQWYYYGERFYIENTDIGYALFESEQLIVDVVGYLNKDGLLFNSDSRSLSFLDISDYIPNIGSAFSFEPVELQDIERHFTYLAGINTTVVTDWFDIRLRHAYDVSVGHGGTESGISLLQQYQVGDLRLFWEVGVVYKDAAMNNYYYGIRSQESGLRSDYQVTDTTLYDFNVKAALSYRLSENLSAILSVNQTWLHKDLLLSPLLEDRHYMSGFVGVNYHF